MTKPSPPRNPLDPVGDALGFWNCWSQVAELWWSRHGGVAPGSIAAQRLRALVRYARDASPFYRRHYERLPLGEVALTDLPFTSKAMLMERFDDWCTDRRVTRARVETFLADRERIGAALPGGYLAWKSSGTSGTPGIFLQDAHAMAVYEALITAQFGAAALDAHGGTRLWSAATRSALVAATGDHFASITAWQHFTHGGALERRTFSVLEPTARLVAQLNGFGPTMLASYPSVLALLAAERDAGRLRISPALAWSGGEHLGDGARAALERSFGCRVMNQYGASECLCMASGCREGWLHVNSEWVILEPVDEHGRAAAPGELSHSLLVTNLANWIQPIIRYDLGDRVIAAAAPCRCGNPLPAIRVEGRGDATLELRSAKGAAVRLAPLALATVVELAAGEHRFQVAQTAPDRLKVRFDAAGAAERARIGRRATHALERYLASQSLANVRVTLDSTAPRIDARSGKLHAVTVEKA